MRRMQKKPACGQSRQQMDMFCLQTEDREAGPDEKHNGIREQRECQQLNGSETAIFKVFSAMEFPWISFIRQEFFREQDYLL